MKKSTLFLMFLAIFMVSCGTEGANDNNSNSTTDGDITESEVADNSEVADVVGDTSEVEVKSGETHTGKFGVTFVEIPGGTFMMGNNEDEDASPRHLEIIAPFMMGQTEVTKEKYVAFLNERGNNSCEGYECVGFLGEEAYKYGQHLLINDEGVLSVENGFEDKPVQWVTWYGAKAFCEAIGGRLPSESEWEYAARAGVTTDYLCGDGTVDDWRTIPPECLYDIACIAVEEGQKEPCDVATKQANAFGLYDTTGNLSEWTSTIFTYGYGGSGEEYGEYVSRDTVWGNVESPHPLYKRGGADPYEYFSSGGFRCAKDF